MGLDLQQKILNNLNMKYLSEYLVIICLGCNFGLLPNGNSIRQHAMSHQAVHLDFPTCADVMNLVQSLSLAEFDLISIPDHFSQPVPFLKVFDNGSYCTVCNIILVSRRAVQKHQCQAETGFHGLQSSVKNRQSIIKPNVSYQHWWNVPNFSAIPKISWAVDKPGLKKTLTLKPELNVSYSSKSKNLDQMAMMLNQLRSLDQNFSVLPNPDSSNEITQQNQTNSAIPLQMTDQGPFLQSMSWPFSGICQKTPGLLDMEKFQQLCSLASMNNLPDHEQMLDYLLIGWFSGKIQEIFKRVDIKSSILSNLSEANHGGYFHRPFILVRGETQRRYGKVFSNLIVFMLRMLFDCLKRKNLALFAPVTFNDKIKTSLIQLGKIINLAISNDSLDIATAKQLYSKSWTAATRPEMKELSEHISIVTNCLLDQNLFLTDQASPVVAFIQALGLRKEDKSFCLPHEISGSLAALQYVLRTCFLSH